MFITTCCGRCCGSLWRKPAKLSRRKAEQNLRSGTLDLSGSRPSSTADSTFFFLLKLSLWNPSRSILLSAIWFCLPRGPLRPAFRPLTGPGGSGAPKRVLRAALSLSPRAAFRPSAGKTSPVRSAPGRDPACAQNKLPAMKCPYSTTYFRGFQPQFSTK